MNGQCSPLILTLTAGCGNKQLFVNKFTISASAVMSQIYPPQSLSQGSHAKCLVFVGFQRADPLSQVVHGPLCRGGQTGPHTGSHEGKWMLQLPEWVQMSWSSWHESRGLMFLFTSAAGRWIIVTQLLSVFVWLISTTTGYQRTTPSVSAWYIRAAFISASYFLYTFVLNMKLSSVLSVIGHVETGSTRGFQHSPAEQNTNCIFTQTNKLQL